MLVNIFVVNGAFKVIWLSYNLGFSALPENTSGNCEPMVVLVTLPIPLIAKLGPSYQSGTEKLALVLVPSLKFNVTLNEEEPSALDPRNAIFENTPGVSSLKVPELPFVLSTKAFNES